MSVWMALACIVPLVVTDAFGQPASDKTNPGQTAPQVEIPAPEVVLGLTRAALLTLNDALLTGNFTVLRDVGARGFREANNAARLSQLFSSLATQKADLSAVATVAPKYSAAPALEANGLLRLTGSFDLSSAVFDFTLLFQNEAGRWRLFGISVQPNLAAKPATSAVAPKPTAPAPPKSEPAKQK